MSQLVLSKVVGILIKLIPLLKILATKEATSPVIPPPKPIINLNDLNFLIVKHLIMNKCLNDLFFSLATNGKKYTS